MYNLIFFYHGLLAILAQLIIFRELSVLFYGSELFLGVFLSSWLSWVGLGSLLAKRFLIGRHPAVKYFSYGFLALSLFLPFMILLIRLSKALFSFGEFVGPAGTVLFTFAIMSFLCFIIGAQFSLACLIASSIIKKETALGRVYLCEALGSVAGGVLFTFVLIGHVPTFATALVLSLCCVFVSLAVAGRKASVKAAALIFAVILTLFANFRVEPAINRLEWKKYRFIRQVEARNATLSVVEMGSIKNVFADGMLSASFPNPESYEPVMHWPLLTALEPGRVLLIGDFSLGLLKEALKHSPVAIDYVLLDGSFINLIKPYLDPEDALALKDPRVNIHYVDGRVFIKDTTNRYDAVVVNIQEVPNIKLNRYYTQEFYAGIKSVLKPAGGVFALSVASSENYLSRQTRIFNASVYNTLKSIFAEIEIIPGDTITFLCSPSVMDLRYEVLLKRFNDRKISNRYFIPSYIEYKLTAKRRGELKGLLEGLPGAEINRDFRPTAYYYFANFWLNKFSAPLGYLMLGVLFGVIIFSILKTRMALGLLVRKKECVIIFILGFMGILLELILLLSFQIISGYVYWQIGVLFASFMSGLSLGAVLGARFRYGAQHKSYALLAAAVLAIIGLSLYMRYLLPRLVNLSVFPNIAIFVALLVSVGVAVGASFVMAGFLIGEDEVMVKSGSLYAADLWGAAIGALASANFIIPIFGLLGALNFCAAMGLAGLAIFIALSNNRRLS